MFAVVCVLLLPLLIVDVEVVLGRDSGGDEAEKHCSTTTAIQNNLVRTFDYFCAILFYFATHLAVT